MQPHVDTLKANKEETAAAEEGQGRYREEVGKDREKAQRQKSKFSKEQILKVGREGREGRIEGGSSSDIENKSRIFI